MDNYVLHAHAWGTHEEHVPKYSYFPCTSSDMLWLAESAAWFLLLLQFVNISQSVWSNGPWSNNKCPLQITNTHAYSDKTATKNYKELSYCRKTAMLCVIWKFSQVKLFCKCHELMADKFELVCWQWCISLKISLAVSMQYLNVTLQYSISYTLHSSVWDKNVKIMNKAVKKVNKAYQQLTDYEFKCTNIEQSAVEDGFCVSGNNTPFLGTGLLHMKFKPMNINCHACARRTIIFTLCLETNWNLVSVSVLKLT